MKDELFLGIGALVVGGLIFMDGGASNTQDILNQGAAVKDLRKAAQIDQILSNQKTENIQSAAEIAESRYTEGCLVHVIKDPVQLPEHTSLGKTTVKYEFIKEGGVYSHWTTDEPYADGTVLCDPWGNTGIQENGQLAYHAFTPNQGLVKSVVENYPRY